MKVSYNWLKDFIDFEYTPEKLCEILTDLGLEVGGLETVGGITGDLEGVVVGHVLEATQHPNADRLRVCTVDVGETEPLHIVCGAPNVASGQKVPVATVGTTLHPMEGEPFKIKKSKIRGEVSMGMICAEDELGIGHDHDGIIVLEDTWKVGTPFRDTISLNKDYVIEIDLTPNRIDGVSHYGVARDLGAFMRKKPHLPAISVDIETLNKPHPISVSIQAPDKCKRFSSMYISGVSVKESPEWLKQRLSAIGLRPINNLVDITNYVMMELGQPLHAYDADKLKGGQIIVKTMEKNTKFATLDDIEREIIAGEDLMICDAEHMLGIGGIMGGLDSGITEKTQNILLEAAYFDPTTVRKTSSRLGLKTDAAYRFERGTDPNMTVNAVLRAATLVLELAGGEPSQLGDIQKQAFPPFEIEFSLRKARILFGKRLSKAKQIEILHALDIGVTEDDQDRDKLYLQVPPYRVDVQRPQDVMEEILRVYGYNNIEIPEKVNLSLDFQQYRDVFQLKQRYADYLSATGFYEVMNNSLVQEELGDNQAVHMLNPLSEDLGIMRQSMLPPILQTIQYNQNRQNEDLKIYEFGKTYWQDESEYHEKEWLVMALSGKRHVQHWKEENEKVSLFSLTREIERLQAWFLLKGDIQQTQQKEFDFGLSLVVNGKPLATFGKVHTDWVQKYDLRNDVYYAQIDWTLLADVYFDSEITFQEIPQFPSIKRDLSLLILENETFSNIQDIVYQANPKLIRKVELHDVYTGEGIPEGKKSYLISIELRDDSKTLADKAADKVIQRVLQLLKQEINADLRK